MNKPLKLLVLLTLILSFPSPLFAASAQPGVKVYMNAKPVAFQKGPVVENGTTLVEFRPIFEGAGLQVAWQPDQRKITGTRKGVHIELTVGSHTAYVNGEPQQLEIAPKLIGGRAYVPLRFIGESSDYSVDWLEQSRTVAIQPTNMSFVLDRINAAGVTFVPAAGLAAGAEWNGKGKLVDAGGTVLFEGDFVHGRLEGNGVFQVPGMLRYEGQWKNSRFDGTGKLYTKGKQLNYEGGFLKGLKDGTGKLYDMYGSLFYEGQFAHDQMEGAGTFYGPTGNPAYIGEVKEGMQEGQGKLFYDNGNIYYEGAFVSGKQEGIGKSYDMDGKVQYEGLFHNGKAAEAVSAGTVSPQLDNADWKSLRTRYFQIYYVSNAPKISDSAAAFDTLYEKLYATYAHYPAIGKGTTLIPVYVMPAAEYKKALGIKLDAAVGQWYQGKMFVNANVFASADPELVNRVFRHEMIHALTFHSEESRAGKVPGWFSEGAAVFHDYDAPYNKAPNTREAAFNKAVQEHRLLSWSELTVNPISWNADSVLTGYAEAASIWGYLAKTYGESRMLDIFYQDGDFEQLLEKTTGKNAEQLENDWLNAVMPVENKS
jgi:antitoxin component YwqK of YwqJK toxin-antitoxin module